MAWVAVIVNGILGRLDGWGDGDPFLNIWPFKYIKGKGINYARYAIGIIVYLLTHNIYHLASYSLAVSIPYGEKHWWMRYGYISWFIIGALFGGASLSWANALWTGMAVVIMKYFDTDQSIFEFCLYSLGTLWLVFQ